MASLIGRKFGKLVVLSLLPERLSGHKVWECICECGGTAQSTTNNLNKGHTTSCGCARIQHGFRKKGIVKSTTYQSWASMITRCTNPKTSNYKYYGGKGIIVEEYLKSFENFLSYMGERPIGKTLDRINNKGNYTRGNLRWATPKEQANNRGNSDD